MLLLIRKFKADRFIFESIGFLYAFNPTKMYAKSVSIQSNNVRPEFVIYTFVSVGVSG